MRRRRRTTFGQPLPPGLLPRDFVARHDLFRRLYTDPLTCLTPRHDWAPMTDAEWAVLRPILADHGCGLSDAPRPGKPMLDPRGRLDAIFRAVTLKRPMARGGGRATWGQLPAEFGKSDTVSRTHRRWCARDLWMRLLLEVAAEDCAPAMAGLRYRICCAFRRGWRQMGLRGLVLARRLRLYSALPAPSAWLPDPDLSEIYTPFCLGVANHALDHPGWLPQRRVLRLMRSMLRLIAGRSRIGPALEPL